MTTDSKKGVIYLTLCFWTVYSILFNVYGFKASMVMSAVICVLFFSFSIEEKWLFTFSALPFMGIFKFSSSLPSTSVILYALFIADSLRKGYKIRNSVKICMVICFLLQLLLLLRYEHTPVPLISSAVNWLFITQSGNLLGADEEKKKDFFLDSAKLYLLSVTLMTAASRLMPDMTKHIDVTAQKVIVNGEISSRYAGIAGDPNYYTQLIIIGIALGISALIVCRTDIKSRLLIAVCCIYLMYSGILTFSKSFYVAVAIMFVITLLYIYRIGRSNKRIFLIFFILTPIIAYSGYYLYQNFIIPGIFQRVTATVDITSGRASIWKAYLELMLSRPDVLIFGAGVDNAKQLLIPYYGKAQAAHNVFIELLSDYGIVGCVLLYMIFSESLKKFFADIKEPMGLCFIMFAVTAMSLSLSAYDTICFVVPLLCLLPEKANDVHEVEKGNDK